MAATTTIRSIDRDDPDPAVVDEAAQVLRAGGLVAFATETVYGLGADATNAEAVARIFAAKGRPSINPLIVHVDSVAMGMQCVRNWTVAPGLLAEQFWPGPLTLVLPRSSAIPDVVTAGLDTVGIRIPGLAVARALIARLGRPIAAPSANRASGISPTLARHVLKDLDGRIDMLLDSGPTTYGLESTVLDLSSFPLRMLRPGAISSEEIEQAIAPLRLAPRAESSTSDLPVSPGLMPVHYAPRTRAVRAAAGDLSGLRWPGRSALLVFGTHDLPPVPESVYRYDCPTPDLAGKALYALLHACDDLNLDLIVVVPPPDRPEWLAIRDRLERATVPL